MKITNDLYRVYNYRYVNQQPTSYKKSYSGCLSTDVVTFSNTKKPVTFSGNIIKSKIPTLDDVISLFSLKPENLPKHLNPIVSSNNNKTLGFTLSLPDEYKIRVLKKANRINGENLMYLSFDKSSKSGDSMFINIDLETKDFLRTNRTGKLAIEDDTTISYTEEEIEKRGLQEKLDKLIAEIFDAKETSNETTPVITKIQQKTRRKKISVKDFEDKKINEIVAKEYWAEKQAELAKRLNKEEVPNPTA